MLYERMLAESKRLEKELESLQKQLNTLPEGKLISSKNGPYYKWYKSDGTNKIYIPHSNHELLTQLAQKKYLSALIHDLKNEKEAIDHYLSMHNSYLKKVPQLLTDTSRYNPLLTSFFSPVSDAQSEWMFSSYKQNPLNPEQLTHKCLSGNYVRSKSESIIDLFLYTNNLAYRYECELVLDGTSFYPDFTIYHPHTNQIIYWEHFGMMDSPKYSKNAYAKLQFYTSHGIIPSINLIITFETKDNPLSHGMVQNLITYHFL